MKYNQPQGKQGLSCADGSMSGPCGFVEAARSMVVLAFIPFYFISYFLILFFISFHFFLSFLFLFAGILLL